MNNDNDLFFSPTKFLVSSGTNCGNNGLSVDSIFMFIMQFSPLRWERLGDIVVLPVACFKDTLWEMIGEELWPIVAKSLGAKRLARQVSLSANMLVCWLC